MKTIKAKISDLKVNADNPRYIKDEKFNQLVKSIKELPQMLEIRPIVVNDDMVVLGGNMRLRACQKAGLKEVPIIKASDLTPAQQQEFIIKDNVGFGSWDWDVLANEWDKEQLEDWGLELPFDVETELEAEEDNYQIPDEIETDIVLGDLIEIGKHRLLCGDSTDADQVAKLMDGDKADLGLTDPPYNIGYKYETHQDNLTDEQYADFIISYVWNLINNSDKQIITTGKQNLKYYYTNFDITEFAVWYAKNKMSGSKIANLGLCEPILFMGKFDRKARANDMFEFNVKQQKDTGGHTCPKVIDFFNEILLSYSDKLILDLFLGSGTTMVAAHQLKRKCYGMELDNKYCQVIIDRMLKLDEDLEVKVNGKPYKVKEMQDA
ncbi:hypothetical protein CMI47_16770 [Candidatus Pacearchaeota archaeon]|jgi:hypothetical protein|nr:hypothetical protein [Candidatus Pacearchaeota archaeon]|tara:strand:- start:2507 stop:3643 length:1137 start_codon:yes stop_codon:yes gene_type:complete